MAPEHKKYLESVFLHEALPRGEYYAALPAVRHLAAGNRLRFPSAVTFFVGENGTGKSTLLEAIAVAAGFHRRHPLRAAPAPEPCPGTHPAGRILFAGRKLLQHGLLPG